MQTCVYDFVCVWLDFLAVIYLRDHISMYVVSVSLCMYVWEYT